MNRKISYTRIDNAPIRRLRTHEGNVTPSWKRWGTGSVGTDFQYHDDADYLSITVTEYSEKTNVTRTAMVTLDARKVFEFLDQKYGVLDQIANGTFMGGPTVLDLQHIARAAIAKVKGEGA